MDIYKRFGISTSFLDAIQSVTEKKHMDPVDPKQAKGAFRDRKDKDIDNDGDADKTDKYLHTRRNAITKAMSEKKKGKKDVIDTEPKIDDKSDMRGVQEAERRADAKVVKVRNPDGTMSFRKERPEIKVEEVEEIEELSKSTLGSYVKKRVKQLPDIEVGYQMAEPGRELKGYEKLKKKVNKGIGRAVDRMAKEEAELEEAVHVIHPKTNGPVHITDVKTSRDFNKRWNQESDKHRKEFGYDSPVVSAGSADMKGKTPQKMTYSQYKSLVGESIELDGKLTKEEVEEIDELSKGTLASYAKKASRDARIKMATGKDFERHARTSRKPEYKAGAKSWEDKYKSDARRREAGVYKAIDRLAKEDADLTQEDIDFINELNKVDELDKKTLDKYSTRARFSSNPKHREGALKAMDKIKDKSKNEK